MVKITFTALNYRPTSSYWNITDDYAGREDIMLLIPVNPWRRPRHYGGQFYNDIKGEYTCS